MSSLIPLVSRAIRTSFLRAAPEVSEALASLTLFDREALMTSPTKSTSSYTIEEITGSLPVVKRGSYSKIATRSRSRVSLSCYDKTNDAMCRVQTSGISPVVLNSSALREQQPSHPFRHRMLSTIAQSRVGTPTFCSSSTPIAQVRSRVMARSFATQDSKKDKTGDTAGGDLIKPSPFSWVRIGDNIRVRVTGLGVLFLSILAFAGYKYCEEETEGAFCSGMRDSLPDWIPFPKKK